MRVLRAAIEIADREGIDAVTMRRLGEELGVEAMSLYHHVRSKDEIAAGIVDLLISEIPAAERGGDWRAAIRGRALAAREHLRKHPWVFRLITGTQGLSPALLRHYDSVIGDMLRGGLSHQLTHTAMHVLSSRTLGFTEDLFLGNDRGPEVVKAAFAEINSGKYPAIAESIKDIHHDDDVEFVYGLDLILDGFERARHGPQPRSKKSEIDPRHLAKAHLER
ncbi:MAG TPA: TetR/AcrR family transcriptional regulator [Candidatus Acidoferrales bacterium]|nr:TetR/AcrR family transcriptional regulator [Candidatus Acidoferrales bacterium]